MRSIQRVSEMSGRVGVVREACIFLHFGESLGSWQRQAVREEKMVLGQCYGLCEGVPLKICVPNTLLSMQTDCSIEKLNFMCVFFFLYMALLCDQGNFDQKSNK